MENNVTENGNSGLNILESKFIEGINSIRPDDRFLESFDSKLNSRISKDMGEYWYSRVFRNNAFRYSMLTLSLFTILAVGIGLGYFSKDIGNILGFNQVAQPSNSTTIDTTTLNTEEISPTEAWQTNTFVNTDGSKINLMHPTSWEFKKINERTFAILNPNGAAFGYDFGTTSWQDCSAQTLFEVDTKYKRYYDKTSHLETNWYLCEQKDNKYQINIGNQFTYLANSDSDLQMLDQITKTVTMVSATIPTTPETPETPEAQILYKFISPIWDFEFSYPNTYTTVKSNCNTVVLKKDNTLVQIYTEDSSKNYCSSSSTIPADSTEFSDYYVFHTGNSRPYETYKHYTISTKNNVSLNVDFQEDKTPEFGNSYRIAVHNVDYIPDDFGVGPVGTPRPYEKLITYYFYTDSMEELNKLESDMKTIVSTSTINFTRKDGITACYLNSLLTPYSAYSICATNGYQVVETSNPTLGSKAEIITIVNSNQNPPNINSQQIKAPSITIKIYPISSFNTLDEFLNTVKTFANPVNQDPQQVTVGNRNSVNRYILKNYYVDRSTTEESYIYAIWNLSSYQNKNIAMTIKTTPISTDPAGAIENMLKTFHLY